MRRGHTGSMLGVTNVTFNKLESYAEDVMHRSKETTVGPSLPHAELKSRFDPESWYQTRRKGRHDQVTTHEVQPSKSTGEVLCIHTH